MFDTRFLSVAFVLLISRPVHECQVLPRILGGEGVAIQDVPYHVAIYSRANGTGNYKQICGGTLISTTQVVTAAHCVWDNKLHKAKDRTLFKVAAGKTYISWEPSRNTTKDWAAEILREVFGDVPDSEHTRDDADVGCQRRDVAKIAVPRRYLGLTLSYAFDIALLTLAEEVTLNDAVGVAHVDWEGAWTRVQLVRGRQGTVAGWGISETGLPSQQLRAVRLPYVDADTCFDSVPLDQKRFVTQDKFCAGYVDRNISVCPGDSGGGLVFYHRESDKHYLRGVASVAFKPAESVDACYAQRYTAFTNVDVDVLRGLIDSVEDDVSAAEEECGRRGRSATPLIAGGQDSEEAEFPWHVNVYEVRTSPKKIVYICGGSLVSPKFVISAAFCFTAGTKVQNPGKFRITAGSVRVPFEDAASLPTVQTFRLAKVTTHPAYSGRTGFFANSITVVQLDREATWTPTVAPVCVDWDGAHEGDLRDGAKGVVPGSGINAHDKNVNTLQWIELPYVSLEKCITFARSRGMEKVVFAPNFCAGEINGTRGLCLGDTGGGFNVVRSSSQRYYLRGVVGALMRRREHKGRCDPEVYSVMHTVAPFLEWIRGVMTAAAKNT